MRYSARLLSSAAALLLAGRTTRRPATEAAELRQRLQAVRRP